MQNMALMVEAEATLTSQNQITIPVTIRKALHLREKSRIKFQVYYQGQVMMCRIEAPAKESRDPALQPFLSLLTRDMKEHPNRIKPFPVDVMERARSVIEGVDIDLNGPLEGED